MHDIQISVALWDEAKANVAETNTRATEIRQQQRNGLERDNKWDGDCGVR